MLDDGPGLAAAIVGCVAVGVILAVAAVEDEQRAVDAQWAGLCASQAGDRLDDDQCPEWDENGAVVSPITPGNYFMWIDTSTYRGVMPGVGQRITVGQRNLPSSAVAAKGIPKTGGEVAAIKRGGFGVGQGKTGGSSGS